ncbi:mitochondrial inner membrane protease ATP23 homolog isoform X3 [Salvia hispanica]|uniref:mitochondrial inner membrane protease ATP23 homolog isoform X3 n=1 Tax=Salvia hispanica TaxID=49212 RepID=UPI00200966D4|nr:mitochondrial inner membrane protease ATP23 homolog isoform X3 [Salvia hispanica]
MGDDDVGSSAASPAPFLDKRQQCQDIIQKNIKKNSKVKFLIENLEKSGCRIGRHFIRAVNCDQPAAGGFARAYGIEICSNYLHMEDEVVQAMIHELIHAYDDCRVANLRWSDSNHQACSEIRANHLSGDCHYVREILRGHLQLDNLKLKGHEPLMP